jgi:curved DNA-binding protein CbpA
METAQTEFPDYYELMQISPKAEPETIQRVYRILASRYHPDNPNTGDMERFLKLNDAYRILGCAETRAEYDEQYRGQQSLPLEIFNMRDFATGVDGEANRRMGLLCMLYHRRRVNSEEPGLSVLQLERMMTSAREHLVFTVWYLKDKGYIRQTEDSSYAITGAGIDHVEQGLPKNRLFYRLLKEAEDGSVRHAQPAFVATDMYPDAEFSNRRSDA